MSRIDSIVNRANVVGGVQPIHLYCSDDKYKYYFSKPYLINQYGVEAVKVKVVDKKDSNNFILMSPPVIMLERSNGISMFEINKIQDFVTRNLFIIYDVAREVDN